MASYSVSIKASAVKELEKLPKGELAKILDKIEVLKDNPRPSGAVKLALADLFRIRQGDYRILYSVNDKLTQVEVIKVGHRGDVYR